MPCEVGFYSSPGASKCTACKAGYYCMLNVTSYDLMSTKYICPAGMHCPEGLSYQPFPSKNPCLPGHYCVQGNEVIFILYLEKFL